MYSYPSRTHSLPPSPSEASFFSVTAVLHQLVDLQHINVKYHLNGPKILCSRMFLFTNKTHNPVVGSTEPEIKSYRGSKIPSR